MKKITIFLLLLSIIILASCGTRKSAISNYKANVVTKEEVDTKVDSTATVQEVVKEKEITKQVEKKDITEKDVKTEVKEVFKDGQLVEKTTTTTVSDKIDRSTSTKQKEREKQTSSLKEVVKRIEQTANKVVDSLIKEKNKTVESKKGIGFWWILIVLILAGSAWYWLRKMLP